MNKVINFSDYIDNNLEEEKRNKDLENKIKEYQKDKSLDNYISLKIMYQVKRLEYESFIEQVDDLEWKKNLGMGYWIVLEEYKTKPLIKEFIAEFMLKEIYDDTDKFNLEIFLHSKFKNKDKILKMGVKNFIINYTLNYDECLSGYITKNDYLLKEIEEKINKILSRWDQYNKERENIIMNPENIIEIVDEFTRYNDDCIFTSYDLAIYLKNKLGIDITNDYKKKCFYDTLDSEIECESLLESDIEDEYEMSDEEFYNITFQNLSLKDQKVLSNFNIIINEYIKGKKIPDSYDYQAFIKEEREKLKDKRKTKKRSFSNCFRK